MPRNLQTSLVNATTAPVVRPLFLVELEYGSGTQYFHNGVGLIELNNQIYTGAGHVGDISEINEASDQNAQGVELNVSGINTAAIATALGETYQGRPGRIKLALLDENFQLIADPVTVFSGRMDTQDISLGETGSIKVGLVSAMADWDRPRVRRYNNDDQQSRYPGDKGLEFVEQTVNKEVFWGNLNPPE